MIINHNMSAINANRQMSANQAATAKSTEKLSSGLRINRAGDDAAGLAISEKMRAQVAGLDQATSNAQDGISLVQTAEGALNESHSILQRMRELAVQSANDTNTDGDRAELQKEVEQLTEEITRISTDTEFNTKKLLNGNLGTTAKTTDAAKIGVTDVAGMEAGAFDVTINTAATKAATAAGTATFTGSSNDVSAKSLTINGVAIDLSKLNAASGQDIIDTINSYSKETGVTAALSSDKVVLTANEYGSDANISVGGADAAEFAGALTAGIDAEVTVNNKGVAEIITAKGQTFEYKGGTFEAKGAATNKATVNVTSNSIDLQIGANAGQTMTLNVEDMGAKALGISNIDISNADGAQTAITDIDDAITKVSSQRANLGAVQNRLEHTINNLGTSSENLTSAESRIRDVDMAEEMMEFTKNNVLSQASQAMLAQAKALPNQVLSLLQ